MKTYSTQQEILLFKDTSLSQRELYENDASEKAKNLSPDEQLESACWNGWLDEMLPGIVNKTAAGKSLYMWDITAGKNFFKY